MLVLWLAVAFFGGRAAALDPSRTIDQFIHTAWTKENGAPQDIWALAQTRDGYLWIGSSRGLFRFDGVTFEQIEGFDALPARSDGIASLLASRSGELWIGHFYGGLSVYRNGRLEDANPAPPHGSVARIVQDPSGGIWAATRGVRHVSLRHFSGGRWDIIEDGDRGLPKDGMIDMLAGRDGTIWLSFSGYLVRLPFGGHSFEKMDGVIGANPSLGQTGDGKVWVMDSYGLRPQGSAPREAEVDRHNDKGSFVVDRDGAIWAQSNYQGLLRVRHPEAFARQFESQAAPPEAAEDSARNGVFSNAYGAILEDQEGNIWVASGSGLDRLKNTNFVTQMAPASFASITGNGKLLRAEDGDVYSLWTGSAEARLLRDHAGAITSLPEMASDAATACAARDQGIWVIKPKQGIFHFVDGHVVRTIPTPDSLGDPIFYASCAEDGAGRFWVGMQAHGIYRFEAGRWTQFDGLPELGNIWPRQQTTDRQGRLLMYFSTRSLVRVDGDKVETIWDAKDISIRFINAIHVTDDLIYLCGERGLAAYDGTRVKVLSAKRFPFLSQISGIAETAAGETWMVTGAGVARLPSAELRKAFDDPAMVLHPRIFNFRDGLKGESLFGETNAVVASQSGRVWFKTTGGLTWIDPKHLYQNDMPPNVFVRGLEVDGVAVSPEGRQRLAEGASSLRFDYTATSLTAPEKVAFRYRLEGVDKEWVEAGSRREAFYTNLAPGSYRFQVIASNNDGVWNTTGASVYFDIPPTFLQSRWFLGLCAAITLVVLWLLYRLRLQQMASRLRLGMNARVEERERIARELHDTLLQSIQGMIFRFQAISSQIASESPARMQMERALDKADELLAEGRDRVISLRAVETGRHLPELLDEAATRILGGSGLAMGLATEGKAREIAALVAEEIVRIGEEFLFNSLQHADARKVEIMIKHGSRALTVRFADDGCGIEASVLEQGGRDGHFGLRGMRERAQKIGAQFSLTSRPGAGTELTIAVPAAAAYLQRKRSDLADEAAAKGAGHG